jgi:hypothetical protein
MSQSAAMQQALASTKGVAVIIALVSAILAGTPWALAQMPAPAAKKVIRLEAIKVDGRIQKPQAFYILQRSNLNFEGLELKQSFIPKILDSVEKKPF